MTTVLATPVMAAIEAQQAQLVDLLRTLIKIPSESDIRGGEERVCQAFMREQMCELGLEIDEFTAADVPRFRDAPGTAGFMPFVPGTTHGGGEAAGPGARRWPDAGGALRYRGGGRVTPVDTRSLGRGSGRRAHFGRGASDDKEGLAAMLFALDVLRAHGFQPASDLYLASTIHEENGYGNGMLLLAERGYRPAGVLYLDGCRNAIEVSHCGAGDAFLTVTPRKMARNALWQIDRRVAEVGRQLLTERAQVITRHPLYTGAYFTNAGVTVLPIYEKTFNRARVTDWLRYNLKVHSLLGETPEEIKHWLEESFRAGLREFAVRLDFRYPNTWFEPSTTDPGARVVRALSAAFTRIHGREAEITCGSKCDAYILRNYYGIPTISFGPTQLGGENGAHSPDEAIAITDLVELAKVTAQTILLWQETV